MSVGEPYRGSGIHGLGPLLCGRHPTFNEHDNKYREEHNFLIGGEESIEDEHTVWRGEVAVTYGPRVKLRIICVQ
jgi:hypothetical protein